MKKRNKFFAIAVLAILSVCFSALCAVFASADSAGSGVNITSWGDAESGDFGALTAVTTEKFGGEHSFEIPSEKQVRITSPSTDGMLYKGTLKVKAAEAGTTFKLIATATSQTTAGGWDYSYLFWDDATLGTEWADYSFDLCYRYDGEEKALYYSKDGRTESKQENVASPVAGFDLIFRVNGTVYVDDISIVSAGIPESPLKLPAYTVGETVYAWDFEDGIQGWYGEGGSVIRFTDEETDVAHGGNYAVKTTGVWTRQMNADPSVKWLTEGYFFEASMYARKGDAAQSAKAVSEMFIWGANAENDEWEMCNTRIVVIPGSEVYDDYTLVKSIFGVYSDGTNSYAYHANGNDRKMILEKLPITAGKLITYQYALDIGEKNAGTIWADDISIKKATVCKDAKITVEGYENVTLTVSQNGTELATQPAVESEGNVYTVKNLAFEKFSTAYTINIKSNGETVKSVEVDFVNSEKNVGKEYEAALTVKTENGDIVTDATVTVGDRIVTENSNGVYTVTGLDSDVEATVSREGYIDKKVNISALNKNIEVVLLTVKEIITVEGNIINGNMESGFNYPNYNSVATSYEVSSEDRYDGSYSLKIAATGANAVHNIRMDTPGNVSGTVYYYEFMIKGVNGGSVTLGASITGQNTSGWVTQFLKGEAVELTGEWQKVSITYAFRFEEAQKELYGSINGEEETLSSSEFASMAALDLQIRLTESAVVYVDDIVVLETYDATVTVNDENGIAATGATFTVTDFNGTAYAFTPDFDEQTKVYTFAGLKGVVKITAAIGEKTFDPVTVSISLNNVVIEESYTVTLTLKDQRGSAVSGAKVVARKGITTVGEFTDNKDGTYTLEGVMGQVTLVITAEGYAFEKVTVSSSNATLTVTGEKEAETQDSSGSGSKSCGGAMGVSLYISIAFIGLALFAKKKN